MGIKSSPHVNIDTILRSGMYDFLIIDKLFQLMFDLIRITQNESVSGDSGSLEILKEVMSLAAQTSLKASHCVSAAFVANRVALKATFMSLVSAKEISSWTVGNFTTTVRSALGLEHASSTTETRTALIVASITSLASWDTPGPAKSAAVPNTATTALKGVPLAIRLRGTYFYLRWIDKL